MSPLLREPLDPATPQAWISYQPDFLPEPEASALLAELLAAEGWERQPVRGRLTLRANAWLALDPADPSFVYRYSGQTWVPRAFPPALEALRARLAALTEAPYDAALLGLYPDGRAGLDWHDDDDFPGAARPIASVSLGAPRRFALRRKRDHETVASWELPHGSLLVMGGTLQRDYQHSLRKSARDLGPRVNLSFRCFAAPRA
ncbi:MAG: alpha-ketoglutarate-dependent dioxygenase AlkB [Planctomycetota bacterium]